MRSKAINYLKCIATLLVINTHISNLYPPQVSFLSWGGYFANSIFFFVSGYCLTNVNVSFCKWYWKRFVRIYIPYLFFLPFLFFAGRLIGWNTINILMPFDEYHFIPTILFLYIFYYFLTKLSRNTRSKYPIQVLFLFAIALIYFLLFFDKKMDILQHFTLIETIFYLIPMLLGGMAKEGRWVKSSVLSGSLMVIMFFLYLYQSFRNLPNSMKILIPCIGVLFAYSLGCFLLTMEDKLSSICLVDFIANITLESYLVQFISKDAFTSTGFPTNIVYHVICVIAVAYCLHWFSNIAVQWILKKTLSHKSYSMECDYS